MRRAELAANLIFLSPFFAVLAVVCIVATPFNITVACAGYALGLLLLIYAKTSQFRQGVWFSFGPSRLAPEYRRAYWWGYGCIAVGAFINIAALTILARAAN